MQYLPYILLFILFALPLAVFLKTKGAFSSFTYRKFVAALNLACLVYLVLCVGFAFLFAWLDSAYNLEGKVDSNVAVAAEVSMGFMMVSLGAVLPLFIILNIIKWFVPKKKTENTVKE